MDDFTPVDEVSDWAIAYALELIETRMARKPLATLLHVPQSRQAVWEALITVARSSAKILRPHGTSNPTPIGHTRADVAELIAKTSAHARSHEGDPERHVLIAGQLIGSAAGEDFDMCRALAASVVSAPDGAHRGRLVVRAMLEILALEPVDPNPQGETP